MLICVIFRLPTSILGDVLGPRGPTRGEGSKIKTRDYTLLVVTTKIIFRDMAGNAKILGDHVIVCPTLKVCAPCAPLWGTALIDSYRITSFGAVSVAIL